MSQTSHPQDYWDRNLDIQNLGELSDPDTIDIETEIDFWRTPDQEWVYSRLGDPGGEWLIDIGGGLSMNAIILARQGARVIIADISIERLRVMKHLIERCDLKDKIFLVCCAAEEFPFRSKSIDTFQSKAVLIHTRLDEVVSEVRRVLKQGGKGFFVEPTTTNPLVNLYRCLFAPKEWQAITHYFDKEYIEKIKSAFPDYSLHYFYLFSFLAFFWQFGVKNRFFFKISLSILYLIDRGLITIFPFLKRACWFVAFHVRKEW